MARVTIEDCLKQIPNRFVVAIVAIKRAKALKLDKKEFAEIQTKNKEVVTALREIAAGKIKSTPFEGEDY
jgi:DNA-directed RNA polymerase subunit omega